LANKKEKSKFSKIKEKPKPMWKSAEHTWEEIGEVIDPSSAT
jgi:hypothetical protein